MLNNLNLNLDALKQRLHETEKTKQTDDRFYRLKRDDNGNGVAYLRWLPSTKDEMPWAFYYRHWFQLNGIWVYGGCPTTIGEKCPVCEYNSTLWRTGDPALQNQVRRQSRQKRYVANIFIIDDKNVPQNNGKVFLFEFGPKIFGYIKDAIDPEFPDQEPFNPFDPVNGRNFILRARVFEKQVQYDRSEWGAPEPLFGGNEEKIMEVINKTYGLSEFIEPSKFDANALAERLEKAIGSSNAKPRAEEDDEPEINVAVEKAASPTTTNATAGNDGSDDDLEKFRQLLG